MPDTELIDTPARGVLGDGALRPGKYNMALVRRAVKKGWPIPRSMQRSLIKQMTNVMERSDDERNQIAAAKVLVAAHGQNIKVDLAAAEGVEAVATGGLHNHLHLHGLTPEEVKRLASETGGVL